MSLRDRTKIEVLASHRVLETQNDLQRERIERQESEIATLRAQLALVVEALKPFAEAYERWLDFDGNGGPGNGMPSEAFAAASIALAAPNLAATEDKSNAR
jgi:hypothetical protein